MDAKTVELIICYMRKFVFNNDSPEVDKKCQIIDILSRSNKWYLVLWPLDIALSIASIVVSCINLVVLTRPSMIMSSMNTLLIALEVVATVYAILTLCWTATIYSYGFLVTSHSLLYWRETVNSLTRTTVYLTIWLTVVIGFWRFIGITWYDKAFLLLTKTRAICVVLVFALLSILPNLVWVLRYSVTSTRIFMCTDVQGTNVTTSDHLSMGWTPWALRHTQLKYGMGVLVNTLFFLLPCVCMLVAVVCLVWNVCWNRTKPVRLLEGLTTREKDQDWTTLVLIVMLMKRLASHATVDLVTFFSDFGSDSVEDLFGFEHMLSGNPLVLAMNTASFLFYYVMGNRFKETFCGMFSNARDRTLLLV